MKLLPVSLATGLSTFVIVASVSAMPPVPEMVDIEPLIIDATVDAIDADTGKLHLTAHRTYRSRMRVDKEVLAKGRFPQSFPGSKLQVGQRHTFIFQDPANIVEAFILFRVLRPPIKGHLYAIYHVPRPTHETVRVRIASIKQAPAGSR